MDQEDRIYACPRCGGPDKVIEATRYVSAYVDAYGVMYDDKGGDTEWDDDSATRCTDCQYEGDLSSFTLSKMEGEWAVKMAYETPEEGRKVDVVNQYPTYEAARNAFDLLEPHIDAGARYFLSLVDIKAIEDTEGLPDYLAATPANIERAYERSHTKPLTREWTYYGDGRGAGPTCLCPMAVLAWCAVEDGYYSEESTPVGLDDEDFDAIATELYGEWFTVAFVRAFDNVSPNAAESMKSMNLLRRPAGMKLDFLHGDQMGRLTRNHLEGKGWKIRRLNSDDVMEEE